jgi:hypothetical protein
MITAEALTEFGDGVQEVMKKLDKERVIIGAQERNTHHSRATRRLSVLELQRAGFFVGTSLDAQIHITYPTAIRRKAMERTVATEED